MAEGDFVKYFVRCPKCGKENSIGSVYLRGDGGTYLHCVYCKNFFYTSLPTSPYKKQGDSVAYTKET